MGKSVLRLIATLIVASIFSAGTAHARFLQTDPVGYEDSVNLYVYVENDPINWSDPTGEHKADFDKHHAAAKQLYEMRQQQGERAGDAGIRQQDISNGDAFVLYRAVSTEELSQIRETGSFQNPEGIENKYFSLTEQGAQREAEAMNAAGFSNPPVAIVTAVVDTSVLTMGVGGGELDMGTVDGGVPTIVVPTDQLPNFQPGVRDLPLDEERAW